MKYPAVLVADVATGQGASHEVAQGAIAAMRLEIAQWQRGRPSYARPHLARAAVDLIEGTQYAEAAGMVRFRRRDLEEVARIFLHLACEFRG